ncbi:MAG: hypothetical protein ABSG51_06620 [Terracidiphilus sp.]|jgi:hypothetical protein
MADEVALPMITPGFFTSDLQRGPLPELLQTVLDTATWCSREDLSGNSFRSPELDPFAILDIPDFSHSSEMIEAYIEKTRDCYRQAINWINQRRSELLRTTENDTSKAVEALSRSKLLLYNPLETVSDGASEAGSLGFYNIEDAPPWDTRFLYDGNDIFCFVPESAVSRAQDGIDANPVDCIHWANWSEVLRTER